MQLLFLGQREGQLDWKCGCCSWDNGKVSWTGNAAAVLGTTGRSAGLECSCCSWDKVSWTGNFFWLNVHCIICLFVCFVFVFVSVFVFFFLYCQFLHCTLGSFFFSCCTNCNCKLGLSTIYVQYITCTWTIEL